MLTIRLQRTGKKNKPEFRVVLAQKTAAAGKKFVEILGHYNPRTKALGIKDENRLQYWIAQHVQMSPTIHNLFVSKKLVEGSKTQAFKIPKKPVEPEAAAPAATPAVTATAAPETPAAETPAAPAPEAAASDVTPAPEASAPETPAA